MYLYIYIFVYILLLLFSSFVNLVFYCHNILHLRGLITWKNNNFFQYNCINCHVLKCKKKSVLLNNIY